MSLKITGFDQLERNLANQIRKIEGAQEHIVKAGAEVQFKQIKKDIFVDEGTARDKLIIGKPYQENGETFLKIGWPKGSGVEYRAHFVEWGTIHQRPQLKITKAMKASSEAKVAAMKRVMRKEYGLNG